MNLKKIALEGNGRESFSVRLRPEIMAEFKRVCDNHGFSIGKRIEIAIINDIERINQNHIDSLSKERKEATP